MIRTNAQKREHECKQILQRLQKEIIMDFKIKYIYRKNQLKPLITERKDV